MIIEQTAAQLNCQLTSIDPLVQLIQAAANDHLRRQIKKTMTWIDPLNEDKLHNNNNHDVKNHLL
jgi:hypothetical protein